MVGQRTTFHLIPNTIKVAHNSLGYCHQRACEFLANLKARRSSLRSRIDGNPSSYRPTVARIMDSSLSHGSHLTDGDVVFLIHGTFATDANWIDNDGEIARSLRATAAVTIVPFRWSGLNSHKARLRAGRDLEKRALELSYSGSSPNLHFIGHSHGGNVALYALRNSVLFSQTKTITFLGTPFIRTVERSIDNRILFFARSTAWVVFFSLLMTALFVGIGLNLGGEYNFFVMFFLFMPALLLYLWFGRPLLRDRLSRVLTEKLKLAQQEALRWLWQPVPTQPVYIATVPADEARLWLKLTDAIASLPWTMWALIYRSLLGIVIGYIVYNLYAGAYADILGEKSDAYIDGSEDVLFVVLALLVGGVGAPIIGLFFSSVFRGNPLAFGWEGLWSHALVGLKPSERPNWALPRGSRISILKGKPYGFRRHSAFYQDSEIITNMTRWLAAIRAADSEISSEINLRANISTGRSNNRVRLWFISAFAGLATFAASDLLSQRHMAGLDSLQVVNRGSIDGLDQRYRRKLLSASDVYIGAKQEQKWPIDVTVKPKLQVCFVTGSLEFSNYSSWFEIEVDDYWWFSDELVQSDEKLRKSLLEEGAIKVQGRWRSSATARVLFHESKDGRRVKFTVPLESDRDILREFRISAYNGASKGLTIGVEVTLICSGELAATEAQILKQTQAIKFNPKDGQAYTKRGDGYFSKGALKLAIEDYTDAIHIDRKNVAALEGRAASYFTQNDYGMALADYSTAITLDAMNETAIKMKGYVDFIIGDFRSSVSELSKLVDVKPSSTYPVLLLYLAKMKVSDSDAIDGLRENVKSLKKSEWPFAAAELFLGERSPEATLLATSDLEERCEAEFYIGEFENLQEHKPEALQAMQVVIACPNKLIVRHLAEAELQRVTSR
jgi:lipoprotein NlpI